MVVNRGRSPLLRRPAMPDTPLAEDRTIPMEQLRHALQVLRRAPQLSGEARRRGTRALEAACTRFSQSPRG